MTALKSGRMTVAVGRRPFAYFVAISQADAALT
jgi:hypothetical protein